MGLADVANPAIFPWLAEVKQGILVVWSLAGAVDSEMIIPNNQRYGSEKTQEHHPAGR